MLSNVKQRNGGESHEPAPSNIPYLSSGRRPDRLPFQRKHLDGLEPGETRERGGEMAIGAKLRCKSLTPMAYCMDTIGSSHSQETNMPLPFTDPET
jgi:hypothetical protein